MNYQQDKHLKSFVKTKIRTGRDCPSWKSRQKDKTRKPYLVHRLFDPERDRLSWQSTSRRIAWSGPPFDIPTFPFLAAFLLSWICEVSVAGSRAQEPRSQRENEIAVVLATNASATQGYVRWSEDAEVNEVGEQKKGNRVERRWWWRKREGMVLEDMKKRELRGRSHMSKITCRWREGELSLTSSRRSATDEERRTLAR